MEFERDPVKDELNRTKHGISFHEESSAFAVGVAHVVASKYRASDPLEKQAMRESVAATYESLPAGDSRKLIGETLDRRR